METSTSSNGGKAPASTGDGGGAPPQPAPLPVANAPPPFLVKTYDMVDDPSTDKIVSWSRNNNSFVVWDSAEFSRYLLPKYFKHNNFSSFVRQLNTYGFRKVDSDRWEFANEGFLRGKKHLLKSISRRKPAHGHHHQQQQQQSHGQSSSVGACVEVGKFGLEEEVERLKRDKNVLMQELVRLRQQQQTTDSQLQAMIQRLQGMEQRQQQMMSFLAKAMNSPGFLAQFMQQQNESNRRISEGNKKRRLMQEDGISSDSSVGPSDGQIVKYQPLMNEASKAMLRQILKLNSPPRLENFNNNPDSFLIGDASSTSNALDPDSSLNHVSGVTLQEVPPTSGQSFISSGSTITGLSSSGAISKIPSSTPHGATSVLAANQLLEVNQLIGTQEVPPATLPTTDALMHELSQIVPETNVDVVGSAAESGAFMDPNPSSLAGQDKISLELGGFFSDPETEWDNSLMDEIQELPGVSDPFWEMFLESPHLVETEAMDSTLTDDTSKENEKKPLENLWGKSEHMEQLTEQMGLLSSDVKKV
ncbi:heat shock factor HSF8-like [Olea europaea subsp. europaea]|uniref:Heat stress transcription factor n=1 Tax=Olea europaea subsp. europaea TaxID=158383 RepID=A0A8S0UKK3_OLEEU|nr:heat shock factor HSF8-like [Olea europaea subsp. europaea]